MSKILLGSIAVLGVLGLGASRVGAVDVSTKVMLIKDNADTAKRLVQVQSKDVNVHGSDAVAPDSAGAALHIYSATDDFCAIIPGGPEWKLSKRGKWTYRNKLTKNTASIKDGNFMVKIKSAITYTLLDNPSQGTVNAQVQFGAGARFCMRCTGNKKDNPKKFWAKDCVAAACDPEPSSCVPTIVTTTTSTTSTTTTTAPCSPTGTVLVGALPMTFGRFNYNATLGLPGASAACSTNFPGSHLCSYTELQAAEAACNLVGLKDIATKPVTSFWAIDSGAPALQQCNDDAPTTGSGLNWEYGTAHTMSRGERVTLDGTTGALGPLLTGVQCNISGQSNVGCCQ